MSTSEVANCIWLFVSRVEDIPVLSGTFLIASVEDAFTYMLSGDARLRS
jgi:hypothetical protein